jgi:hypothetical protein
MNNETQSTNFSKPPIEYIYEWFKHERPRPIEWYKRLTNEERAAWITAVATAVQTLAVCGALIVAFYEWRGHREESTVAKREAALRLSSEVPETIKTLRVQAEDWIYCLNAQERHKQDAPNFINEIYELCKQRGAINLALPDAYNKLRPLEAYVERVQWCISAKVCDDRMSYILFCRDAYYLRRLAPKEIGSTPLDKDCDSFFKSLGTRGFFCTTFS